MTPDLKIVRFSYGVNGTFGQMVVDGQWLFTVERAWQNNEPYVSCIPEGLYRCRPRRYNAGGYDALEVCDVSGRTNILFHKANLPSELAGCIAPTSIPGCLNGQWAGLSSAPAFELLMEHWGDEEFDLQITNVIDEARKEPS